MTDQSFIRDLTVAEFRSLLKAATEQGPKRRIVRGIAGIAEALQVSVTQAKRIKASGVIDRAITQSGRVILTDADYAVELYTDSRKRQKSLRVTLSGADIDLAVNDRQRFTL